MPMNTDDCNLRSRRRKGASAALFPNVLPKVVDASLQSATDHRLALR
jgi:hypothetical protein